MFRAARSAAVRKNIRKVVKKSVIRNFTEIIKNPHLSRTYPTYVRSPSSKKKKKKKVVAKFSKRCTPGPAAFFGRVYSKIPLKILPKSLAFGSRSRSRSRVVKTRLASASNLEKIKNAVRRFKLGKIKNTVVRRLHSLGKNKVVRRIRSLEKNKVVRRIHSLGKINITQSLSSGSDREHSATKSLRSLASDQNFFLKEHDKHPPREGPIVLGKSDGSVNRSPSSIEHSAIIPLQPVSFFKKPGQKLSFLTSNDNRIVPKIFEKDIESINRNKSNIEHSAIISFRTVLSLRKLGPKLSFHPSVGKSNHRRPRIASRALKKRIEHPTMTPLRSVPFLKKLGPKPSFLTSVDNRITPRVLGKNDGSANRSRSSIEHSAMTSLRPVPFLKKPGPKLSFYTSVDNRIVPKILEKDTESINRSRSSIEHSMMTPLQPVPLFGKLGPKFSFFPSIDKGYHRRPRIAPRALIGYGLVNRSRSSIGHWNRSMSTQAGDEKSGHIETVPGEGVLFLDSMYYILDVEA